MVAASPGAAAAAGSARARNAPLMELNQWFSYFFKLPIQENIFTILRSANVSRNVNAFYVFSNKNEKL